MITTEKITLSCNIFNKYAGCEMNGGYDGEIWVVVPSVHVLSEEDKNYLLNLGWVYCSHDDHWELWN
jgi:hypothetical protein